MPNDDIRAVIEGKTTLDPVFGCLIWSGKPDRDGYGTRWTSEGPRQAHREVYRELVGEPPAGLVLDHLCRRRRCVWPVHLEPVTGAENDRRRSWRYRCRIAFCRNGHSMADAAVTPEMGRLCRRCQLPTRTTEIATS